MVNHQPNGLVRLVGESLGPPILEQRGDNLPVAGINLLHACAGRKQRVDLLRLLLRETKNLEAHRLVPVVNRPQQRIEVLG